MFPWRDAPFGADEHHAFLLARIDGIDADIAAVDE
jgi:hypothetical protein